MLPFIRDVLKTNLVRERYLEMATIEFILRI